MAYRHWPRRTTWTIRGGSSPSRATIRDGTVSCLRSGWLVATSKFLHKVRAHYDLSVVLVVVFHLYHRRENVLEAEPRPSYVFSKGDRNLENPWMKRERKRDGKKNGRLARLLPQEWVVAPERLRCPIKEKDWEVSAVQSSVSEMCLYERYFSKILFKVTAVDLRADSRDSDESTIIDGRSFDSKVKRGSEWWTKIPSLFLSLLVQFEFRVRYFGYFCETCASIVELCRSSRLLSARLDARSSQLSKEKIDGIFRRLRRGAVHRAGMKIFRCKRAGVSRFNRRQIEIHVRSSNTKFVQIKRDYYLD